LSSALDALVELKCPPFAILGLAKRNEEIFVPGRSEPYVLDKERPALKLLQALRDEAHRFAVSYHRLLRLKRIQESLLDEIPGLGPARKKTLLETFGSLRELRKATPEEIAGRAPGIGLEPAKAISEFLKRRKAGGRS
jgi:excinuclease ABC subunit C